MWALDKGISNPKHMSYFSFGFLSLVKWRVVAMRKNEGLRGKPEPSNALFHPFYLHFCWVFYAMPAMKEFAGEFVKDHWSSTVTEEKEGFVGSSMCIRICWILWFWPWLLNLKGMLLLVLVWNLAAFFYAEVITFVNTQMGLLVHNFILYLLHTVSSAYNIPVILFEWIHCCIRVLPFFLFCGS